MTAIPLFHPELSWLEFNRRVLGEAQNDGVPLLERVKFLAISAHNLDEFLMIRLGELRDAAAAVRTRTRDLLAAIYACWNDSLVPLLRKNGIRIERFDDLSRRDREAVDQYFERDLRPVLAPLTLDPGHSPFIANLALHIALRLESPAGERHVVIIRLPQLAPRLVPLAEKGRSVLVEDLICSRIERVLPSMRLRESIVFRVIRSSDISLKDDDGNDRLRSIETELRRRARREIVWVETERGADESLLALILRHAEATRDNVYFTPGPPRLSDLIQLATEDPRTRGPEELRDPPFQPRIPQQLASPEDIFSIIRRGDILLHRPYDSFTPVIELLQVASEDPQVVAIKQTLYRTDPGSLIVEALAKAAENGKHVTAVVELQARFDEKKNITWARHLEESGVQVMYGIPGFKTHCKACLIVRREKKKLRRYVHLSTGNYNATTARIYTDLDLFTCDKRFGADMAQLFNMLTGSSAASLREPLQWRRLIAAPADYRRWVLEMIERERRNAQFQRPARISVKCNALVDPIVIEALYRASVAGVTIELFVRGICCLVPGLPAWSENITVTSVIDRFLEHARVFRFENGGEPEIYISSGDWMPRNFDRRVEVAFPVRSEELRRRIEEHIFALARGDNVKSWRLDPDGRYHRVTPDGPPVRGQEALIARAREHSFHIERYEKAARRPPRFRKRVLRARRWEIRGLRDPAQ